MPAVASLEEQKVELERIFEEHHRLVFQTAYRITGNIPDAEDVLQTIFTRLLQRNGLSSLLPQASSYLRRAAVNAALDVIRRRRKEARVGLEAIAELSDSGPGPDQQSQAAELRNWLRRAVAELHPRTAEIFVLRFFEDVPNVEIAEILKISESAVAVTLHRIRTRLERDLENELGGRK